jgi:hypothetical protein
LKRLQKKYIPLKERRNKHHEEAAPVITFMHRRISFSQPIILRLRLRRRRTKQFCWVCLFFYGDFDIWKYCHFNIDAGYQNFQILAGKITSMICGQ